MHKQTYIGTHMHNHTIGDKDRLDESKFINKLIFSFTYARTHARAHIHTHTHTHTNTVTHTHVQTHTNTHTNTDKLTHILPDKRRYTSCDFIHSQFHSFITPPRNRGGVYFHCSLSVCVCLSVCVRLCL